VRFVFPTLSRRRTVAGVFKRTEKPPEALSDATRPDPREEDLVEALRDAYWIAETLAQAPVRSKVAGKHAAGVLRAMRTAAWVIVYGKSAEASGGRLQGVTSAKATADEEMSPSEAAETGGAMSIEAAETLFANLAQVALAFAREEQRDEYAPHTESPAYREALFNFMRAMEAYPHDLIMDHFYGMACVILTGTILYPKIDQPAQDLAQKLHDRLGVDFFRRNTSTDEKVKAALAIAGVPSKSAWNLLNGAQHKRTSRERGAKKAAKATKPLS
jgi:hypothetical protein